MIERTLSIIKPDAVKRNLIGEINSMLEKAGFKIIAMKMIHMTKEKAKGFYIVHKDRPFYDDLTTQMSSGPVVVQVLEREDAVAYYREIMGATNPANAKDGTIRAKYALSVGENSVHGSDSIENANIEINYFFSKDEICER
jgi:nucleoside-diphosphate kinase